MTTGMEFRVDRENFDRTDIAEVALPEADELEPGQALLRVDRFALTANNISYAATGVALRYWEFFPTAPGMGVIPVWGFAEVAASRCEGLDVGERLYGYWPMATHLVVTPGHISRGSFVDVTPHRQSLPVIYNQYLRCAADPLYRQDTEALQMLLRPLFTTSFLLDDFLEDNDFFEADTVLLTSASSKTALGMAYLLHRHRAGRERDYRIVGLTSEGNRGFVEGLGCYDQVLCYPELEQLDAQASTVVVDFAGNAELLSRIHRHVDTQLRYSCLVGASHWDKMGATGALPGPEPIMFFAPTQAEKRISEWGAPRFQQNLAQEWQAFTDFVSQWMQVETYLGPKQTDRVYHQVLAGRLQPESGHIVSLSEA